MNIFFDVDATLIADDGSLRPFVRETFERLIEEGHDIYVWSGVGIRWEVVRQHKLESFVKNCFVKPLWAHHERLSVLGVHPKPDFCVDDHLEIILAFGGVTVMPYYYPNSRDREMQRVYEAVKKATNGNRPALEDTRPAMENS